MKGGEKYVRMNLEKRGRRRFISVFFLNFADPTISEPGKPTIFFIRYTLKKKFVCHLLLLSMT